MADGSPRAPALSVLILNHNYARFLSACLESVLSQSFTDFEVIVIDDASTDDSREVLRAWEDNPRVTTVLHEANRGFVASLIEGTDERSHGEFLTVISADDFALDHEAFARQVAQLRANTSAAACVTAFVKVGPGDERSTRRLLPGSALISGKEFLRRQLTDREFGVLHSGTMIRAEAYRRAGGYRANLRNYVDLAMWLSLAHVGPIAYIDHPLYGYRVHGSQLSGSAIQRRGVLREGLTLLRAEAGRAAAAGVDVSVSRVLRSRIADLALADAFAGRRVRGIQRCLDALVLDPKDAVASGGWWIALARSIAGTHLWHAAAAILRRRG